MYGISGPDLLRKYCAEKKAFWTFPVGVAKSPAELIDFVDEISRHHELVESFEVSQDSYVFVFDAHVLINSLLYCDILKSLRLVNTGLRDREASLLKYFLESTPTCTHIDFSVNYFTSLGIERICQGLWKNTVVLEFAFRSNRVKDKDMHTFGSFLANNRVVENIDLSDNLFGVEGEKNLYEGLKKNDALRAMEYTHLKQKYQPIAEKLRRNLLDWRVKFVREMDNEQTGKWNRSKLMFIGQGRAGKTSTVNRLLNKGFDSKQDSTVGASVSQTQTSTTKQQNWKQVQEDDPEFVGKGMKGAGRLVAAKNRVQRVDKKRKAKLANRKKQHLDARKRERDQRAIHRREIEQPEILVPVELSKEATQMMENQRKREQEANDLLMAQDLQRQEMREAENRNRGGRRGLPGINDDDYTRMQAELAAREAALKDDERAHLYADAIFKAARETRDSITFSLWDYGGQSVFYALHHLFLTKYGVYVLCFDLTEVIKDPPTAKDYLSFWLNSVNLHAPTAPVLLVGTHLDSFEPEKEKDLLLEVDEFIKLHFKEKFKQIVKLVEQDYEFYPVDNKNNKGVSELRFDIERVSRKQSFVTADVSMKWMFCLDNIMIKRDTGGESPAWMKLADIRKIAATIDMNDKQDIERMLVLFHELGVLVRLTGTEELRNIVTLDPQWLLDGLCKVIRDERLHGPSKEELTKVGLVNEMQLLYDKGLASEDVMKYLWSDDAFREQQKYLLDLMKHMVLISDWDFEKEKMYLVPSMLIARPEDLNLQEKEKLKVILDEENKETEKTIETRLTDYVVFDFSEVFLPTGVFERLVCLCVSYSTALSAKQIMKKPELFKQWAKIWMGNDTVLMLEQKKDEVWISVEDPETAPTCYKAVNSMLGKLNADLMGRGLRWSIRMVKEKTEIIRTKTKTKKKKQEKPVIKKSLDMEMAMEDAKKVNLQPWFVKETETPDEEREMLPELVDLENFVDSF